jgi:hypothetical protein
MGVVKTVKAFLPLLRERAPGSHLANPVSLRGLVPTQGFGDQTLPEFAQAAEASDESLVAIDPMNPRRLLVSFEARSPGDCMRVLTMMSPVPEPSSALLIGLGLAALTVRRQSRLLFRRRGSLPQKIEVMHQNAGPIR